MSYAVLVETQLKMTPIPQYDMLAKSNITNRIIEIQQKKGLSREEINRRLGVKDANI